MLAFAGTKRIWPNHDDLGYYHWRVGKATSKDSINYKVGEKQKLHYFVYLHIFYLCLTYKKMCIVNQLHLINNKVNLIIRIMALFNMFQDL